MVCDRCIKTVTNIFSESGFKNPRVSLGEVDVEEHSGVDMNELNYNLKKEGFEIVIDHDKQLVNQIKALIVDAIHHNQIEQDRISEYISGKLNMSYNKLSTTFSRLENKTIEQFTIEHKIEKAKELMSYGELSISEISYQLNYSSPQHFARQFKKITGLTPTQYMQAGGRKKLDTI